MQTTLLAIGRLRPAFRALCDDYLARVRRYGPVVERELRGASPSRPAAEHPILEGERLLAAIPRGAAAVALDRQGDPWSSEDLARRLDGWRLAARPVALIVGGPLGLSAAVLERAEHRWSLGRLTLPHELARVVVVEQWYRAWTMLRGEPYHK